MRWIARAAGHVAATTGASLGGTVPEPQSIASANAAAQSA